MCLLSLWAKRRWERCRRECLEWILFPVGACYLYVALGSQRPERCIVTIVQSASRWPGVVQLFWCDIECRPLSVGTPEQDACFVAWSYQSNSPRLLRILAYDVCNTHFIWYWVTDWSFMPIHYSRLFHLIFVYLWDNFSSQKQTDTHMYLWQECAALLCREISLSRSLAIFSALFQIARDTDKCESSAWLFIIVLIIRSIT